MDRLVHIVAETERLLLRRFTCPDPSAFGRLHLDRVVATTMAGNAGSWRVLEKCGLRRASTFYSPDADQMPRAEHGDFVYELARGDWTGPQAR